MALNNEINFSFDELPLLIENGWSAGLVAGEAVISYHDANEWCIERIYLDSYRKREDGFGYVEAKMLLEPTSPLHGMMYHRLENEYAGSIADRIREDRDNNSTYVFGDRFRPAAE